MIEAVFEYKGYLIMVGMYNHQGEALTKEQKQTFYDMLNTIELNDLI